MLDHVQRRRVLRSALAYFASRLRVGSSLDAPALGGHGPVHVRHLDVRVDHVDVALGRRAHADAGPVVHDARRRPGGRCGRVSEDVRAAADGARMARIDVGIVALADPLGAGVAPQGRLG